jgi:hypothetical protein
MQRKVYSRGEREEMIMNVFYQMVGDGKVPTATAYFMAKSLGLNSAQHIRKIMDDMAFKHILTFTDVTHRPGIEKRVYCPFPSIPMEWEKLPNPRPIRINGKMVK